jgi:hypothetical protein
MKAVFPAVIEAAEAMSAMVAGAPAETVAEAVPLTDSSVAVIAVVPARLAVSVPVRAPAPLPLIAPDDALHSIVPAATMLLAASRAVAT